MNIVIVSLYGTGNAGGVERVCHYLREILSRHHTVKVITKTKLTFGKLDALIQPILMTLRLCFMKNSIIFSNSWQSFLYPVDFSIHHGTTRGYTLRIPEAETFGSRIIRFMEKMSCKTAKKLVVVSHNAARELQSLYGAKQEKITVINNFVDDNIFYPCEDKRAGDINILFAGRLEPRKGLTTLKKLSDCLETAAGCNLSIACNNSKNIELFKNNKKTKINVGLSIGQMRDFYNSGDVLFFPSLYEGFPMVTLEALSCGIPVIGTEFAIMEELRAYDFTKISGLTDIPMLLEEIKQLVGLFRSRKKEIHIKIKQDFGREQYEKKLLGLIGMINAT